MPDLSILPVLVVDLGLALAFVGAVSLVRPLRFLRIRSRGRAFALFLVGVAVSLLGMLLPPPGEKIVLQSTSLLDDWMPRYEFVERHELRIHASPEAVYRAMREVTAREIRLFRPMVWLRRPSLPGRNEAPVSVLNPAPDRPLLESMVQGGFLELEERSGEEVVLGIVVIGRDRLPPDWRPAAFRQLDGPGYAKGTVNFRVRSEAPQAPGERGWTLLTTETRVHANDPGSRRRFAAYWRVIYPGSSTIRYFWLRAIRDRAERTPENAFRFNPPRSLRPEPRGAQPRSG